MSARRRMNWRQAMRKPLLMLLAVIVGSSAWLPNGYVNAADAINSSSLVAYYPLNSTYKEQNKLNPAQALSSSSAVWQTDYVTLVNPGNANNGHIAGTNPAEAVTGDKISFSLDIKLNGTQTRTTSAANTLLSYGADNNQNLTLRPYYGSGVSAVVLKQSGVDVVVASFPAPAADMWHNYTISLDGTAGTGKLVVYVDGVKAAEAASNGIGADEIGNGQFRLNRTISTYSNLDSHYRDVRVFKDALNAEAALELANEITGFAWNDLLATVPLTDGLVVRNNLTLFRDANIQWASSDNNVINASTGAVTRPAKGTTAKTVTLTMSWSGFSKGYTVTVPPIDAGDYLIADFDFDDSVSGIVSEGAKASVQGTASYVDSFEGSGKAANISSSFWLNVTKSNGTTPLLAGLTEFTLSYDSKPSGGSGWTFFAAPNTTAQTYLKERYIGVIDVTNAVTVERYNNNGTRAESAKASSGTEWKHVDVVVSAADTKLYMNGELQSTVASGYALADILTASGGILQIGKGNWGSGEYYVGLLDNVEIFDRALSLDDLNEYRVTNIAPTLSPAAGQIYTPVTITHPTGNKYLYYTTDGTDPTLASTPYTGPFEVASGTTVKAAAITPNGSRSEIVSADYYGSEWAATANEFRLNGQDTVNNAKISWPVIAGAEYYEVYRGDVLIGRTAGDTLDEYGLETDKDYTYAVKAIKGGTPIAAAATNTVHTFAYDPSTVTKKKDNYTGADLLGSDNTYGVQAGGTWYHYYYKGVANADTGIVTTSIYEQTGNDGRTYGSDRLLGSFEDMRVESAGYTFNPHTGKVVFTAHEEASGGYTRAAIFIGSVTPGGNDFAATFRGRPYDKDSRDMLLFVDDDGKAYILFATRNNSDIVILGLDASWEQPAAIVNTVFVDKHKESPVILKHEGRYYFFGSTANGWYPSQAEYASAVSLDGQWTPLRPIGNGSSFATQANGTAQWTGTNGRVTFAENGFHWGAQYVDNYKDPMGTYARLFPMVFHNGVATADWFYKLDLDPVYGMIPVQSGLNLSLGKKATDSQGLDASAVTDGADLASSPKVQHSSLGYNIVVDLEQSAQLSEINLTTRVVLGSDAVYRYKLEGSVDNQNWTELVDGSANNVVGFVTNPIADTGHYRYVRLTVNNMINVHTGQGAAWADGIIELAVLGTPYVDKAALQAKYDEMKDAQRGAYTNATWKTITEALDNAKAKLDNESATQWEVDRAVLQIEEAFQWALTVHPDKVVDYTSAGVPVGETWYDTEGNPIQAHGGGFLQQTADDGKPIYYWVGENKIHNGAAFHAVTLYSSRDLINWTYEGDILNSFSQTVKGAEYGLLDNKWERPKLLYNEKTKKYVLYGHWETANSYATSQIAVATADQPAGPYTFLGHWRPGGTLHNWRSDNGIFLDSEFYKSSGIKGTVSADVQADVSQMGYTSRDFTVFADDDGTAYLISAEGHSMRVHRLNDDYTDVDFTTYSYSDPATKAADFESYSFYDDVGREAPAVVRADDGYYMASSGQSGWLPNQGTISYNADLTDPAGWTPVKDNGLIVEQYAFGNNSTYYSQPTNIMKLTNADGTKSYVYMGDRWKPSQLGDSRYVWLPITFNTAAHNASMSYTTGWKLNAANGQVQLPQVSLVSQGKSATITNNDTVTGIEKANDGYAFNLRTSGDSTSFFGGLVGPYAYTIDLGDVYDLARIDVAYRLYNGSEMYHAYQIFGSTDNVNWTELVNNNANTWAGFNSDKLSGQYRYVKLKVNEVRRVDNNALSNSWGSGLVEVQVYAAAAASEAGDTVPPTTTADIPVGWSNADVTATLHAEDAESGVAATYYSVDGGPAQTGETILLTEEGIHTITYWSVDASGNTEEPHAVQVKIDRTASVTSAVQEPAVPDGSNGWYVHPVTVALSSTDSASGVDSIYYSLDDGASWQMYAEPIIVNQDGMTNITYYAVDQAGNKEQSQLLTVQLDQAAPVVLVQGLAGGSYTDDQSVTFAFTVSDSLSGVDANAVAATLDGQPITNGADILFYALPLGEHVVTISAVDQAGNAVVETVSFQTTTSLASLTRLVSLFEANGSIDNQGIANSLQKKLEKNNLESFMNEVNAQSGKHIASEAAAYLLRDAQYLSNLSS
ncbi:family 43 glycosylhydrolase (plasmid) [Paenibacillus cellulosilyticus]|nr:LamG-like jellyroll fold domain-containing protein [Paenibacillus cellulosilyticus]QKS47615.1 family 43 glycosylhydrolase [Paenibacillus cellulosilyticus]